jgi:hypothetical protein
VLKWIAKSSPRWSRRYSIRFPKSFEREFTMSLCLARDPRAGSKTERVIDAVEDGIFLADQIYEKALLRFGQGNIDFKW